MFRSLAFVCLLAGAHAFGQNNYSFVSVTGSDSNNCTLSAPCATVSHAYGNTNPGGSIHALSSGNFGSVTINKPITIDGGGFAMQLNQVIGDVGASYVALRNLAFDTMLPGGYAIGLTLRTVAGFGPTTLVLEGVSILGNGGGSPVSIQLDGGSNIYMTDVSMRSGAAAQIFLNNTGLNPAVQNTPCNAFFTRVTVEGSSADGLQVNNCNMEIRDSNFRGAAQSGVDLTTQYSNVNVFIRNSVFSANLVGFLTQSAASSHTAAVKLDGNAFTGNGTGIVPGPASVVSFRTNAFANNGSDGAPALTTSLR